MKPPMCLTEEDAKFSMAVLRKNLAKFTASN